MQQRTGSQACSPPLEFGLFYLVSVLLCPLDSDRIRTALVWLEICLSRLNRASSLFGSRFRCPLDPVGSLDVKATVQYSRRFMVSVFFNLAT